MARETYAASHPTKVAHECVERGSSRLVGARPKDRRGMHGGADQGGERRLDELTPVLGHPEAPTEDRLRRGRAQEHQHLRLDPRDLGFEPRSARADLLEIGLLVDPALCLSSRV
jgi:hypothetical protein